MRNKLFILLTFSLWAVLMTAVMPAQAQIPYYQCYQPVRLNVGYSARVTTDSWLPNRVRAQPNLGGQVIGQIPAGGVVTVIEGPHCDNGITWWRVQYDDLTGWTAEGNGYDQYWLEPYTTIPNPSPYPVYCDLTPRLTIGQQARVTPGLPNVVRTAPGTQATGADSVVIGEIPGDGVFSVMNGPQCGSDGRFWWLVDYNGLVGWTAEGEGNTYWLEPYAGETTPQCPGALPSRLTVGGQGRVLIWPPLPNRVRIAPDITSAQVGLLPIGVQFTVLAGPYCNNNIAWFQVSYGNLLGWTAEGYAGFYWLEPR